MLYLRPQRVYKPSALSYLGDPSDIVDSIIDRYLDKDLYRLRIETPRGTSITADNSQITCYAHIFDKEDGTELTDLLKGRGYRPTWLLDGKPIDSTRISEEGYKLTLETDHLPAIYQTVTLQVRDTDILLALTTDENQKRVYSQLIELGSISTHLLKTSEKLLNVSRLDKIRVEELKEVREELFKGISANTTALSELHKHPLTISEEGYWRIWDITQHQYVTTEYQSRGDKGEPGDKGDKGDKPKLTLDSQLRLLADGELLSQQSLKGDKGDRGETGARGATGATGAKGDKGDKPKLTLDSQLRLLADGELLSQQSLKGDKGDRGETGARGATGATGAKGDKGDKGDKPVIRWNGTQLLIDDLQAVDLRGQRGETGATGATGAKGDKGDKGDKPVIRWNGTQLLIDDLQAVDLRGQRGETGARGATGATGATGAKGEPGHSPDPEEVLATSLFKKALGAEVASQIQPVADESKRRFDVFSQSAFTAIENLQIEARHTNGDITTIQGTLTKSNQYIDTAFEYLQSISNQITSSRSFSISTTGYITSHGESQCPIVSKNTKVSPSPCRPPKEQPQIRITLRSDFDQLKRQVDNLTTQLFKFKEETRITPVANCDLRKRGSTLYPRYGDWLLTSDVEDLYISFSGLSAEIGRSIYIQTRRKAYFYTNGHSFYGLPGSSTSVNQWLSNNTTYRFVRCSSTSWFVTSSPSPYPWT